MSTKDLYLELESVVKPEKTQIGNEIANDLKLESPYICDPQRRILLCNSCTENQQTIRNLKSGNENLKRNYMTLKKDYNELEKKCESSELEINALNEHLNEFKQNSEVLEKKCAQYQRLLNGSKMKELKENNILMERVNTNLNSHVSFINKENLLLKAQLKELQKSLDYQTAELKKNRVLYSKMNQEYVVLKLKYEGDPLDGAPKFKVRKAKSDICIMDSKEDSSIISAENKWAVDDGSILECRNCGVKYSTRTSLRSHLGHCLRKSKDLLVPAKISDGVSWPPTQELCRRKLTPKNKSSQSELSCSVCGRSFLRPCNLGNHMRVHFKTK